VVRRALDMTHVAKARIRHLVQVLEDHELEAWRGCSAWAMLEAVEKHLDRPKEDFVRRVLKELGLPDLQGKEGGVRDSSGFFGFPAGTVVSAPEPTKEQRQAELRAKEKRLADKAAGTLRIEDMDEEELQEALLETRQQVRRAVLQIDLVAKSPSSLYHGALEALAILSEQCAPWLEEDSQAAGGT